MARASLTPTALKPLTVGSAVAGVADPAGTASTAGTGNGFTVAAPTGSNVNLWFRAANATGGSGAFTVLAGSQPLAVSGGVGPISVTVAAGATSWIGPIDSSIVTQPDGSILIETSVVMTVAAFTLDGRRV